MKQYEKKEEAPFVERREKKSARIFHKSLADLT